MNLLSMLARSGAVRPLDHALAQSLRRLDPDTPDAVLAAAALASLAVAHGHAGFDPGQPTRLVDDAALPWPEPGAWLAQLRASRWVAAPGDDRAEAEQAPLAWEHGLLYLRRYREYERRLAIGLQRLAQAKPDSGDPAALAPLFAQLFPAHSSAAEKEPGNSVFDDHQARAAALALRHSLLLITGGPGTGKTTTIARLLALLIEQARQAQRPPPRVALAAPTGRAAERMAESLRHAAQQLPRLGVDAALCARLPTAGSTLHRLLGVVPDSPRFRHTADDPLPFDVIVVDEASMIDLPLMTKLVEAIVTGARLALLGDADQLPSVEAGDVLGAVLRAAGDGAHLSIEDAQALQPLLGELPDEAIAAPAAHFAGARVHLQRGHRQSQALQLAPLAAAARQGDAARALSLLREARLPGVHFHENEDDPLRAWREPLQRYWSALAAAPTPAQALTLTARLRLLTAVREGPQGARALNARIEEWLNGAARRAGGVEYFHGRLLIVTENSYRHRLFNGDVGICLRDEANPAEPDEPRQGITVWFPGDDPQRPRGFHPAALPAHESAFAMTVHKAQGSEFDEVWLQLPRNKNRVLSRELLYTGITRARHALHLAGSAEVIEYTLSRHASRWSGLTQRLLPGMENGESATV